jgi:uncharacterized protein (DUF488 family)
VAIIYTIGHSTRTLDELVAALRWHGVQTLVDIRSFPMSRRLPHFNREWLEVELPRCGIAYVWGKELGGRRKKILENSPNTALRSEAFRNYADYMMTEEFERGIGRLLSIVKETAGPSIRTGNPARSSVRMTREGSSAGETAIMCAERMWFQCHRMLVSDYLTAYGHTMLHIDDEKRPVREHKLMAEARLAEGKLVYDGGRLL